jgi:glyoxylase-like metal-dependent hydrolase (beta-lactamase superfamily II)
MGRREYEFWHSSEFRNRLGSGTVYGDPAIENVIGAWVDRYLPPIRDRLELWASPDGEREVIPGVALFDAAGHTPGQFGVAIHSGGDTLLYTADAFTIAEHIAHPEWTSSFDLDRQLTVATRRSLLDRAATGQTCVFHYHFARLGSVVRHGVGFVWEPAE